MDDSLSCAICCQNKPFPAETAWADQELSRVFKNFYLVKISCGNCDK